MNWYTYICGMVITINLINASIISYSYHLFYFDCVCVRTVKIYSLKQISSTQFSIISYSCQYTRSPGLNSSYNWNFVHFDILSPFPPPHPQPLATTILLSASLSSAFTDSTCKWDHTIFLCVWLVSLNIMSSMLLQMTGFPSFLRLNNIPLCT